MSGKQIRLRRLFRHNRNRLLIVPLDHSVSDGPIGCNEEFGDIVKEVASYGTDAIVVHKGRLRHLPETAFLNSSVIAHLSASTKYSHDPNDKILVADVEDAIRRGADCVSVHVNVGSKTESLQLRDMARVADACERYGIPLLAMMYARGDGVNGFPRRDTLAHAASLAVDLGADVVKLSLPKELDDIRWIVSRCPLPVVAAGGEKVDEARFLSYVEDVISGGAVGLASGRNIFQSKSINRFIKQIRWRMDNRRMGAKILSSDLLVHARVCNEPI